MDATIFEPFKTPIFHFQVPNLEDFNRDLISAAYEWRQDESNIVKKSNRGGWHSPSTVQINNREVFKQLTKIVTTALFAATKKINPNFDSSKQVLVIEGWVNINGEGDSNAPHTHPSWTWSACYYASMPPQKTPEAGRIYFLATDGRQMWDPSLKSALGPVFHEQFGLFPSPGSLIIFPSFLIHYVSANDSESDRITVAFNGKFRSK
jgi:uncharacterized protein (TIGR02466 family)